MLDCETWIGLIYCILQGMLEVECPIELAGIKSLDLFVGIELSNQLMGLKEYPLIFFNTMNNEFVLIVYLILL